MCIRGKILVEPNADAENLIVSSSQMKGIEEKLFSCGMPVEALMEKVGLSMKNWLLANPRLLENGVIVLVGPGHNGGDGLVLARELYLSGIKVSLWCPIPIKRDLVANHFEYCISIGIDALKSPPDFLSNELWIEALFGIGQTKEIPEDIGLLLKNREQSNPGKLIALDVPAGICSDTGKKLGIAAAKATYTLAVGLAKIGLLQDIALPYVGTLVRIDIGIPKVFLNFPEKVPLKISLDDIESFDFPRSPPNASKYQRGRVLLITGSEKYKGASLLALEGAIASGVGSIQSVLPANISNTIWPMVPEVVFQNSFCNSRTNDINLKKCLDQINFERIDSLLIGPGLGLGDEDWVDSAVNLEKFPGLLVLDADGLNRISLSSDGWRWLDKREGPTWITPHMHEFCRLFPEIDVSFPVKAAALASAKTGVGVLLKGAHSVIAIPDGSIWQLVNTSNFVSRAGLGDVLAGFAAGIGAMGLSSGKKFDFKLLAYAGLMHACAASSCENGTNAASISKTLKKLVKRIQSKKVRLDT